MTKSISIKLSDSAKSVLDLASGVNDQFSELEIERLEHFVYAEAEKIAPIRNNPMIWDSLPQVGKDEVESDWLEASNSYREACEACGSISTKVIANQFLAACYSVLAFGATRDNVFFAQAVEAKIALHKEVARRIGQSEDAISKFKFDSFGDKMSIRQFDARQTAIHGKRIR